MSMVIELLLLKNRYKDRKLEKEREWIVLRSTAAYRCCYANRIGNNGGSAGGPKDSLLGRRLSVSVSVLPVDVVCACVFMHVRKGAVHRFVYFRHSFYFLSPLSLYFALAVFSFSSVPYF